jgi:hypothetical protein
MAAKTKRLKYKTFEIDSEGILWIHDNDGSCIQISISIPKRQAAALRDFLNQQELDKKPRCRHDGLCCHQEQHIIKVFCDDPDWSWKECRYGRKWKGAK